jgi:GH43 family beta-xylosidase
MPGFRVNEGPSVLIRGGKVYTYLLRQRDGRALYAVGFS